MQITTCIQKLVWIFCSQAVIRVVLRVTGEEASDGSWYRVSDEVSPWLSRFSSATGTTFGVSLPPVYQTGSNPAAADLALINTRRVWTGAFALSAACAAVVGVLLAGFTGSADATVGTQYLFTGLAAVIVGGTSIAGARGDYWRTVLGALIITALSTVLLGHGYSVGDQQIAFGLAILVVVAAYGRDARLRDRV